LDHIPCGFFVLEPEKTTKIAVIHRFVLKTLDLSQLRRDFVSRFREPERRPLHVIMQFRGCRF